MGSNRAWNQTARYVTSWRLRESSWRQCNVRPRGRRWRWRVSWPAPQPTWCTVSPAGRADPAAHLIHSTSARRASHWLSGSGGTRGRWYRRARKATAPVGIHFRQPGHSIHDLEIIPLEKIRQENSLLRKIRESFYIQKFNCVSKGLNKKK